MSVNASTVKISDEVPRDHNLTKDSVVWTHKLESVFKENFKQDYYLRYRNDF